MTTITTWTAGLITGLTVGLSRLVGAIPNIIGAILLLIIGWIIAGIVGGLVTKLCKAVHVDTVGDRIGANGFLAKSGTSLKTSSIIGEIFKWVIRLVFIEMAAEQLGMPQVTAIINEVLGFIPNVIVAILILGGGAFLGQLLGGLVKGAASEAKLGNASLLAKLTTGAVITFAIIAALNELNIAPVVVNTLYIGLVAALALALGLAFGLGGRETAAKLTEQWASQAGEAAKKLQATPPKAPKAAANGNVANLPTQKTPIHTISTARS